MTTTATALALEEQAHVLASSIPFLFADCDEGDASAQAKVVSTIGRIDALRFARTQDAFDATFESIATRRFFLEFVRLAADKHVQELMRTAATCELAGHMPSVKNPRAEELSEDLAERYGLMVKLVSDANPPGKPPARVLEALAGWTVAVGGLRLAAYAPEQWAEWMIGMLWNLGRRALLEVAAAAGVHWEGAIDGLTTTRDRRLLAAHFDQEASDRAARLLGIQ